MNLRVGSIDASDAERYGSSESGAGEQLLEPLQGSYCNGKLTAESSYLRYESNLAIEIKYGIYEPAKIFAKPNTKESMTRPTAFIG